MQITYTGFQYDHLIEPSKISERDYNALKSVPIDDTKRFVDQQLKSLDGYYQPFSSVAKKFCVYCGAICFLFTILAIATDFDPGNTLRGSWLKGPVEFIFMLPFLGLFGFMTQLSLSWSSHRQAKSQFRGKLKRTLTMVRSSNSFSEFSQTMSAKSR